MKTLIIILLALLGFYLVGKTVEAIGAWLIAQMTIWAEIRESLKQISNRVQAISDACKQSGNNSTSGGSSTGKPVASPALPKAPVIEPHIDYEPTGGYTKDMKAQPHQPKNG